MSNLYRLLIAVITFIVTVAMLFSACDKSSKNISEEEKAISLEGYMDEGNSIKVFNGGFEKLGTVHITKKVSSNTYQTNQIDHGSSVVFVYKVLEDEIKSIYRSEVETFNKDYSSEVPNDNRIIMKTPIGVGTTWEDKDNTKHEITGSDVEISTPSGKYSTLEITSTRNNFEIKRYYAKNIGLVKKEIENYGSEELIKVEKLTTDINLETRERIHGLINEYLGKI